MSKLTDWLDERQKIFDAGSGKVWVFHVGGSVVPYSDADSKLIEDSRSSLPVALEIIRRQRDNLQQQVELLIEAFSKEEVKEEMEELDLDPSQIAKELKEKG